ncbi:hypothetical protein AB0I51_46170 [Streptomyces sp. NPDC050549]
MTAREHRVVVEGTRITTPRLVLRSWTVEDAADALRIYGAADVAQ